MTAPARDGGPMTQQMRLANFAARLNSCVRRAKEFVVGRKKGIPGLSFSWKRATGLSSAKGKLSRGLGVPLTRAGRQRKVGKAMGCCVPAAFILTCGVTAVAGIARAVSSLVV